MTIKHSYGTYSKCHALSRIPFWLIRLPKVKSTKSNGAPPNRTGSPFVTTVHWKSYECNGAAGVPSKAAVQLAVDDRPLGRFLSRNNFFSLAGCVLVLHFDSSDHYLFHPAYRLHTNSFHHRRLRVDHSVSVTEVKRNRKEIPPAAPHAPRPWLNSGRTFLLMTAPLGSIERIDLLPTLHLYIGHNSLFSAGSKRRSRHR